MTRKRKAYDLHRVVCERRHGPLGDLFAIHTCDNKMCINPDHLRPGTSKDNAQDMASKNRHMFGEINGNSKLTEAQAKEIYHMIGVHKEIGELFGVDRSTVSLIKRRKLWKHIHVV